MPRRPAHEEVCARLRSLRELHGYTQATVADALKLSRPQYTALETGRSMLTLEHLFCLAELYELTLSQLIST